MRRIINENKILIDKAKVDFVLSNLISSIEGVFVSSGFQVVPETTKHINSKNISQQIIFEDLVGFYYIGLDYEYGLLEGEDAVSIWATKISKESTNLEDYLNGESDSTYISDILVSISPLDEVTIANIAKQIVILIQNNSYR